ncbi:MAG: Gfo/Idh/MocA family oxidoreductase [Armatimonadetes bacterium]|nr:Gfo/Idh/MocA family oxidoreductase [Armatimonadota bacterium]
MKDTINKGLITRRDFVIGSAAATAVLVAPGAFASRGGADTIKVGLIGSGGRGTGAAINCLESSPDVVLWAMGDLFEDRLRGSQEWLNRDLPKMGLGDRYQVTEDRSFLGWDAYKAVIASDVDLIIFATPPGFRPLHLRAAIEAGKHVFMEKPVAVDGPGIRSVFESADMAKQQGLAIVAGTQRRHDVAYNAAMDRIHDGAIGDVTAAYCYWNQGGLWMHARKPEWTDVEWQLRNWLYFTWLSGDHIAEQHIHNMDVCNWAMQAHPAKAISLAGRQVRTGPEYGHIFDHFATEFEYENGVRMISMCRQIDGTASRVGERLVGTKGTSDANTVISGENEWRFEGDRPNPYRLEHKDLIDSIRSGMPLNEGRQVAESTLTAIMGRMAAYTGKEVTWEQALNSTEKLMPENLEFGPIAVPPVAVPGKTQLK